MSGAFETKTREQAGREAWDAFAGDCNEAWLWSLYDLQDAIGTWPGRRDLSFAVLDPNAGGRIAAIVPAFLAPSRVRRVLSWGPVESLGGPAVAAWVGEKQKHKVLEFIGDTLASLAREHKAAEANVSLQAMAPAYRGEKCPRVNPLLAMGCENTLTQTWVIELRGGKEAVFETMEGRARTAIRAAEKAGVTVRPASGPDDLDIYYKLHVENYTRTGVTPHPKEYFEAIWKDFEAKGLAKIFFAEIGGETVAAENFGIYKGAAIYWTGASSEKGLQAAASSLIQWTAIQWMIDNGVEWYETGEAFPGARGGKLKGLNDFKKSFGGKLYPYYRGRISLAGRAQTVLSLLKK